MYNNRVSNYVKRGEIVLTVSAVRYNVYLSVILAKYDEWQELVPKLVSGDIEKLSRVVNAHHTKENPLASLSSRFVSVSFLKPGSIRGPHYRTLPGLYIMDLHEVPEVVYSEDPYYYWLYYRL